MSYPTDDQLRAWARTLGHADWDGLTRRLTHAIDRDRRGGSAIPDGYPSGGSGGGGGTAELTATEAVVHARTTARDEHHERTMRAIRYLEQAMHSLGALVTQLDRIEARTVVIGASDDDWCVVHRRSDMLEPVYRGHYCRWCYDFRLVERVDPPTPLLLARSRGERITETMVRQALSARSA